MDPGAGRKVSPLFPHLFLRPPAVEVGDWKPALRAEVDLRRGRGEAPRRPLRSLFLAAGARGSEASLARDILEVVGADVVGSATEWTVEVEVPGTGTPCSLEVIRAWGDAGVNRVSLALPSTYPNAAVPGGVETAASFEARLESLMAAARRLLSGGIPVVSVDISLVTGRGQVRTGMEQALRTAHALAWIGVPQLALREWGGGEDVEGAEGEDGAKKDPGWGGEVASEMTVGKAAGLEDDGEGWACLRDRLLEAGYESGDGVHFVRRGPIAAHPRAILRREPVLGLGPAAVTFRNPERRANVPEWQGYRSRALAGLDPLEWRERLSREEVRTERVWSRLRSREGLRMGGMGARSARLIREWVVREWATEKGGRVILLPQGWIRMDGLVVDLLRAGDLDRG
jgi:coproporphyrinogen III oxidase-like Fe-S oxidoreductase